MTLGAEFLDAPQAESLEALLELGYIGQRDGIRAELAREPPLVDREGGLQEPVDRRHRVLGLEHLAADVDARFKVITGGRARMD